MADTVALLNCPFCDPLKMALIGRPKIMGYGVGDPAKDPANWHGLCLACGAEGPKEVTLCAAAEAWNRRAPPTDMPPAGLRHSPSPTVGELVSALTDLLYELDYDDIGGMVEGQMERARALLSSLSSKEKGDG